MSLASRILIAIAMLTGGLVVAVILGALTTGLWVEGLGGSIEAGNTIGLVVMFAVWGAVNLQTALVWASMREAMGK